MDFKDIVKVLLPKPIIPQKRYIMLGVVVVYCIIKVYTAYTPDPNDDQYADHFSDVMQLILADGDSSVNGTSALSDATHDDEDEQSFGERS